MSYILHKKYDYLATDQNVTRLRRKFALGEMANYSLARTLVVL